MEKTGQVIKFPQGKRQSNAPTEKTENASRGGEIAIGILNSGIAGAWALVFMVLLWLRGIVVGVLSFVSVVTLLGFLFAFFLMPEGNKMTIGFGITSFSSFVIAWAYDSLLIKLSPEPVTRVL